MVLNKSVNVITTLALFSIAVAVILIHNSPATGYESSIYQGTPKMAWILLFFAIASGIGIMVLQASKNENSYLWVIGFVLILLSNAIILSLHILRGYALWCGSGDPGYHLGVIQAINKTGNIERQNFYPTTHIYLAQISQILNVNPIGPFKWLPTYFALFYMVFIYFIAKMVLPKKGEIILASLAGTAMLHGWYLNLVPNVLSNLYFPVAFYLFIRYYITRSSSWKILFLIMVIIFPIFHPIPAIALTIILITIELPRILFFENKGKNSILTFNITMSLIIIVWGITWISSFYIFNNMVQNIYTTLTEAGPSSITNVAKAAEYAKTYGYSPTIYFFKMYTGIFLYLILAITGMFLLKKKIYYEKKYMTLGLLFGPLLFLILLVIILYSFNLPFDPQRFLIYIICFSSILSGYTLFSLTEYNFARKINWLSKKMVFGFIAFLLFVISLQGISYLYPSPYTLAVNLQNTKSEIIGMKWFFDKKNEVMSSAGWYYAPIRYAYFLMEPEEREKRKDISPYVTKDLPLHLGYDKHLMMGECFSEDIYVVLRELNKRVYIDVYPEMAELRLLPSDFSKMKSDQSLDKLYSNDGMDVWYVHSQPS